MTEDYEKKIKLIDEIKEAREDYELNLAIFRNKKEKE